MRAFTERRRHLTYSNEPNFINTTTTFSKFKYSKDNKLAIFYGILLIPRVCCSCRCPFFLPFLGPLAPRGAVGARHDGLPRQFSTLLPVVCHGLSLSEGFAGPFCDVITPALFRPAPSSTAFDCTM